MRSSERLLEDAGRLLSATRGRRVALADPVALESESTVMRATVESAGDDLGSHVIVKLVTDPTFDQPGHEGPSQRFLNEWAARSFLTSIGVGDEVSPSFLGADRDGGILILGDLGELGDLESLLLSTELETARAGLVELGRSLGRLQSETYGRESRFREVQESLGTESPRCDSTVDQRPRRGLFHDCLDALGIMPVTGFEKGLMAVEAEIHDDTPFRSMIHADAGPQNLLVDDGVGILIDFEYAVYRSGLCDVVGARLGFPQTARSMSVPAADAERLETAFRETVATAIPEAGDDEAYLRALTAAAAHWALNRWGASWHDQVRPMLESSPDDLDVAGLGRTLLVLDGFTMLAMESGWFSEVAAAVESFTREMRRRRPDLEPPGTYPGLRNA